MQAGSVVQHGEPAEQILATTNATEVQNAMLPLGSFGQGA